MADDSTRLLLLSEFALSLSRAHGLDALRSGPVAQLKFAIDFECCGLALLNDDRLSYRVITLYDARPDVRSPNRDRVPLNDGLYGKVLRDGEPRLLNRGDVTSGARLDVSPLPGCDAVESVMCFPLQASERTIGSIAFGTSQKPGFVPEDLHLGSVVAMHLSLALDRWRVMDELSATGRQLKEANAKLEARVTRTSADLKDQSLILHSVLDSMADGVMVVDEKGSFLIFNRAAKGIIGIGPENVDTADWSKTYGLFHLDQTTPLSADEVPLARALRGEATDRVEIFVKNHKLPQGVYVSASGRPLEDGAGRIKAGVVVFHDATERKRAEEEIRTLNRDLERRVADRTTELENLNRELEAFTYSASHDLRAPLRRINGFVRMLEEELGQTLNEEARRYLRVVSKSTSDMEILIEDLLEFARSARAEVKSTSIDLNALIDDVRRDFIEEVNKRQVEWSIGDLEEVQGDPRLIRLVLANLISNALKFTRDRAEARIEVEQIRSSGDQSVFAVRDNGVGFDMKYSSQVFDPFKRLHSRSEQFEGTGIGLAHVNRIVRRHGGRIWAEATVDSGASFFVSLPRPESAQRRPESGDPGCK